MYASLLTKELVELATRRRTYVLRLIFALVATCLVGYTYSAIIERAYRYGGGGTSALGRGRDILAVLFATMAGALILLLPALLAPSLTAEKERDTLVPLLLTRLSPGQIVWQKFCSQGLAVFSLGLVCLPLMAVAFSLGGFEAPDIVAAVWYLLLLALEVGAVSLLAGTVARGTVSAILMAYLAIGVLGVGPLILTEWGPWRSGRYEPILFALQPIYHFFKGFYVFGGGGSPDLLAHLQRSLGPFLLGLACLVAARALVHPLQRRVHRRPWWRRAKRWLQARVRGRHSLHEVDSLRPHPYGRPVRWLERRRNWMAKPLVQLYFSIFTSYACLILALLLYEPRRHWYWSGWHANEEVVLLDGLAWLVMLLVLTVATADILGREIGRGTLQLLLTTPLPAERILRDKVAALRPLRWMLRGPCLVIACLPYLFGGDDAEIHWMFVSHVGLALLLPQLLTYACLWWALRAGTRTRAILGALALVFGWQVGLVVLAVAVIALGRCGQDDFISLVVFLQPGGLWLFSLVGELDDFWGPSLVPLLIGFVPLLGLLAWLRFLCGQDVRGRLLRRASA